jgi:predicted RecB family nuclease
MQGYRAISAHLAGWTGTIGGFVRDLDRRGASYLAYTQVSALEFCPYRYYLEFVERVKLRPQPDYYVKGHIFHEAAARYYRGLARNRSVSVETLHAFIDRHDRCDGNQLKNAVTLALQNSHAGWEVVGVEKPFVLSLGREAPPCVGVIDLVLRHGKHYAVVDHKTGKNFYEPDGLQVAIYREFVRRQFRTERCLAFFDEYRWVNNLDRVRKPAFQRTKIRRTSKEWKAAAQRIANGYRRMRVIQRDGDASGADFCFMCPFKGRCPKASFSSYAGWRS